MAWVWGLGVEATSETAGEEASDWRWGYQVAGTEQGVTEPEATFSACFGGVFLMWHPMKYASMLAEKMEQHGTTAWLLNTGWTGGRYGVGSRIKLKYTRAILDAIHTGELVNAPTLETPVFKLLVRLPPLTDFLSL
jgi:phosphoenolpyruvate carboxykinase (ATP)